MAESSFDVMLKEQIIFLHYQIHPSAELEEGTFPVLINLMERLGKKILDEVKKSTLQPSSFEEIRKVVMFLFSKRLKEMAIKNGSGYLRRYLDYPDIQDGKNLSFRLGLCLDVDECSRFCLAQGLTKCSPTFMVYFTAVMEYILAEILEVSGYCDGRIEVEKITPENIYEQIAQDGELSQLFSEMR